jgi:hypothetical protein
MIAFRTYRLFIGIAGRGKGRIDEVWRGTGRTTWAQIVNQEGIKRLYDPHE